MTALYSGPWRKGDHSQAVIALKRMVSRARPDLFPWRLFDDAYNERLRVAISKIQVAHGIQGTGNTGLPTFRMLLGLPRAGFPGEHSYDAAAIHYLEDAYGALHPVETPAEKAAKAIANYCLLMENYRARWHYLQRRPMQTLGVPPASGGWSDCSEFCTTAFYWARKTTGVYVPDPNHRGYDGLGNSQTLYQSNPHVTGHYEVGDIAVFGPSYQTKHVTICRLAGNDSTSIFTSNGSEAGPLPCRPKYRSDFLCVVRPRLAP